MALSKIVTVNQDIWTKSRYLLKMSCALHNKSPKKFLAKRKKKLAKIWQLQKNATKKNWGIKIKKKMGKNWAPKNLPTKKNWPNRKKKVGDNLATKFPQLPHFHSPHHNRINLIL